MGASGLGGKMKNIFIGVVLALGVMSATAHGMARRVITVEQAIPLEWQDHTYAVQFLETNPGVPVFSGNYRGCYVLSEASSIPAGQYKVKSDKSYNKPIIGDRFARVWTMSGFSITCNATSVVQEGLLDHLMQGFARIGK